MMCEELARALYKDFSGSVNANTSGKNEPIVLILDRRLDPVTPLLNQVLKAFLCQIMRAEISLVVLLYRL